MEHNNSHIYRNQLLISVGLFLGYQITRWIVVYFSTPHPHNEAILIDFIFQVTISSAIFCASTSVITLFSTFISRKIIEKNIKNIFVWALLGYIYGYCFFYLHYISIELLQSSGEETSNQLLINNYIFYSLHGTICGLFFRLTAKFSKSD